MEAPDREASSSADDVEAPTARKGAEEEEEESLARECMKLVILAGVIVAVVLAGEEIGKALLTTRGFLRRHVPLHFFAPALVAIQGARRLCPPVYYCMPVSSLAMLYLVSVLGWLRGGLLYQALKAADFFWFLLIRRWYAAGAAALIDPAVDSRRTRRCLPRDVAKLLAVLDRCWRRRISADGGRGVAARAATCALLGSAWATDEMVTLYFVATRCGLGWPFFCAAWTLVLACTTPEALLKARTIKGIVDAAAKSDWAEIGRALRRSPPWLVAAFALVAGISTLIVHGVHLRLIWDTRPAPPPRRDRAVELADRNRRRQDLLDQQRRTLASGPPADEPP